MSKSLVGGNWLLKSWVGMGGLSDDLPILLKMQKSN